MIVSFGTPQIERSQQGAVVSQRVIRCKSQEDQIRFLRQVIDEYSQLYAIRARARDIVFRQELQPPKDKVGQALAIGRWVQNTITYVEENPEVFQTPTTTIAEGYGDCDDFSPLIGSLLESIGIASELVGMEWDRGGSREFQHIFAAARIDGRVLPLDATLSAPIDHRVDPIAVALAKHPDLRVCRG